MLDWSKYIEAQMEDEKAAEATPTPVTQSAPIRQQVIEPTTGEEIGPDKQYMSGGFVMDIIDAASTGQYAAAAVLEDVIWGDEDDDRGVMDIAKAGVEQRTSWQDIIKRQKPEFAEQHKFGAAALGLAGDVILDPAWLIAPAKVAGLVGKGAKGGAKVVSGVTKSKTVKNLTDLMQEGKFASEMGGKMQEKLVSGLGSVGKLKPGEQLTGGQKFLFYATSKFGRPEGAKEALTKAKRLVAVEKGMGADLAERVDALPLEQQRQIADVIEKGLVVNDPTVMNLANEVNTVFKKYADELVKVEAMSKEATKRFYGRYLPKFPEKYYGLTKEGAPGKKTRAFKSVGVDTSRTQMRAEKPTVFYRTSTKVGEKKMHKEFDTIEQANEFAKQLRTEGSVVSDVVDPSKVKYIEDVPYRIARGIKDEAQLLEFGKYFKYVDNEWAKSSNEVKKLVDSGEDMSGYVLMPEGARWGELSGKYVPAGIYYDINNLGQTAATGVGADLKKAMQKSMSMWKSGKTVWSPKTHAVNFMSNFVLNDMGGVPIHRVDVYADAIKELAGKGDLLPELKAMGFGVDTFVESEIKYLEDAMKLGEGENFFEKIWDGTKGFIDIPSNLYQKNEELFKMAHIVHKVKNEGMALDEAFESAQKWLFDYQDIPGLMDDLRKSYLGAPFLTFSYKVAPRVAETLAERPTKISKFGKLEQAVEGLTPEAEAEEPFLPDWMNEGVYVRLPESFNTEDGRGRYLNLSRILPWGGLSVGSFVNNNPIANYVQEWNTGVDSFTNSPFFSGYPDWESVPNDEKINIMKDRLREQVLPSLFPGNRDFEKLSDQIEALVTDDDTVRSDSYGRVYSFPDTMLESLFGVKTQEVDIEAEKGWRQKELEDRIDALKKEEYKTRRAKNISEAERQQRLQEIEVRYDEVMRDAEDLGF